MSFRTRLIAASTVSQAGNWLTFLAVMQFTQQHFGSAATAASFLVQSLPAMLSAKRLAEWVPRPWQFRIWVALQIVLAGLTVSLAALGISYLAVLVYLGVATTVRTVSGNLFMAFTTARISEQDREPTFTALGATGSLTLIVSPAIGGAVAAAAGFSSLLMIDAVTFVLAAAMLAARPIPSVDNTTQEAGPKRTGDEPSNSIRDALADGSSLRTWLRCWWLFSIVGAGTNAVEMPVLNQVHHFDVYGVGLALTAYGTGGAAAFAAGTLKLKNPIGPAALSAAYTAALTIWLVGGTTGAYVGFFLAGASYGFLSGRIRTMLDTTARQLRVMPISIWGWANKTVLISNVVVYALAAGAFLMRLQPFESTLFVLMLSAALTVQMMFSRTKNTADYPARKTSAMSSTPTNINTKQEGPHDFK
jgi:hypothetical protein